MTAAVIPEKSSVTDDNQDDARSRILAAAAALLAEGGMDAATTRAIASAASVQAPAIYRLFGDKTGLLKAVAEKTLSEYVVRKSTNKPSDDPVEDLRQAWNTHIAFGLSHPVIYAFMCLPISEKASRSSSAGLEILRERVRRIAHTGRLRVSEERAVDLIYSMGIGTVLALLQKAPGEREGVSEAACDTVFRAMLTKEPQSADSGLIGAASALRVALAKLPGLSAGEKLLMEELLQRIVQA